MKIIYRFPALVFYVDKVTRNKDYVVRGKCIGFIILIGKAYGDDKGLLAHEITHAKQFLTHGLLIHSILKGAIRKYRLWSECQAYYEQWRYTPTKEKKNDFVNRIHLFYNLKYSLQYVEEYFEKFFKKGRS